MHKSVDNKKFLGIPPNSMIESKENQHHLHRGKYMALSQRRPRCYQASPPGKGTSRRPQNSLHGWGTIFHPSASVKMRYDRAKEARSRTVGNAVARARKCFENAEVKRVKGPDGRIEDWVRDLVVELVALDGVPTARVPQVIERVRRSFTKKESSNWGGDKDQTISDRSVRRFMCEAYIKAFMYTAKLFGAAPCERCEQLFGRYRANPPNEKPGQPVGMGHHAMAPIPAPISQPSRLYPSSRTSRV